MITNISIKNTYQYFNPETLEIFYKEYNLLEYISFIKSCKQKVYKENTVMENHHIFPRAWFKRLFNKDSEEYNYFLKNKENQISLSIYDHIYAHFLLYKTGDFLMVHAFDYFCRKLLAEDKYKGLQKDEQFYLLHLADLEKVRLQVKEAHSQVMKESHNIEEYKKATSEKAIKRYKEHPEIALKIKDTKQLKNSSLSIEEKEQKFQEHSQKSKEIMARPGMKEQIGLSVHAYFENNSEAKEAARQITRDLWKNESYRAKQLATRHSPLFTEKMKTEKRRIHVIEGAKKAWADNGSRREVHNEKINNRPFTYYIVSPENEVYKTKDIYQWLKEKLSFSNQKISSIRCALRDNNYYKNWCCFPIDDNTISSEKLALKLSEEKRTLIFKQRHKPKK